MEKQKSRIPYRQGLMHDSDALVSSKAVLL
jgi:hypothetical protein